MKTSKLSDLLEEKQKLKYSIQDAAESITRLDFWALIPESERVWFRELNEKFNIEFISAKKVK